MALTEERKRELDAMAQSMQQGQSSGISPQRKAELDMMISVVQRRAAPAPEPEKKGPGFVAGLVRPFAKTAATAQSAIEGVGYLGGAGLSKLFGDDAGYQKQLNQANAAQTAQRDYGVLGKVRPVGVDQETGKHQSTPRAVADIVGTGAEIGAYMAPTAGIKGKAAFEAFKAGGMHAAKPVLGKALASGARHGMLASGLASGGRSLQEAKTLKEGLVRTGVGTAAGGVIGGAIPLMSFGARSGAFTAKETAKNLGRKAAERFPVGKFNPGSRLVNQIIRPAKKEFRFGRNPGGTVVDEMAETGVTPNTKKGLAKFISERKATRGDEISQLLDDPALAGKRIDLKAITDSLDDDIRNAARGGEPALANRLRAIKDGLTSVFDETGTQPVASRPRFVSLGEASRIKSDIGRASKWTGQAFDADANQARVKLYSLLKKEVVRNADDAYREAGRPKMVGELGKLWEKWGGLHSAESSIQDALAVGAKGHTITLTDVASGAAGGAIAGGPGGILAAVLRRLSTSTAVNSRLAVILNRNNLSIEKLLAPGGEVLLKSVPVVDRLYINRAIQAAITAITTQLSEKAVE